MRDEFRDPRLENVPTFIIVLMFIVFSPPLLAEIQSDLARSIHDRLELYLAQLDSIHDYSTTVRFHTISYPRQLHNGVETPYKDEETYIYTVKHIPAERAMLYTLVGRETRDGASFVNWAVKLDERYLFKKSTCLKFFATERLANITDGSDNLSEAIMNGIQRKCDPRYEVASYVKTIKDVLSGEFEFSYQLRPAQAANAPDGAVELVGLEDDKEVVILLDAKKGYLPVSIRDGDQSQLVIQYTLHDGQLWLPGRIEFTAKEARPGLNYEVLKETVFEEVHVNSGLRADDLKIPLPTGTRVVDVRYNNLEYIIGADREVDRTISDLSVEALSGLEPALLDKSKAATSQSGQALVPEKAVEAKEVGRELQSTPIAQVAKPAPDIRFLLVGFGVGLVVVGILSILWRRRQKSKTTPP